MTTTTAKAKTTPEKLAAARVAFPAIHKTQEADTGKYKYRYADLQTVLEAVTPILRAERLELVQTVEVGYLSTLLIDLDGPEEGAPWLTSAVELPTGATPQVLGSAITYARRYAIVTMLGLVTEEDDDGSEASGVQATTRRTAPAVQAEAPVPDGWDSHEQAQAAHNGLAKRVTKLSDEHAKACIAFREEHGWPLSAEKFGELEAIVKAAETFQA